MGLDVIVITVLVGLTIHGYYQGFLKGAGAFLTPVVALWLCLRYSHRMSFWFSRATGDRAVSLVLAVIVIMVASYVGIRIIRSLASRLFDRLRMWGMDQLLGGALGLFKATMILWVLIAFAFIAYPKGREVIRSSPLSAQILLFGDDVPFLRLKLNQANNYVKGIAKAAERYQLPQSPDGAGDPASAKAIEGLDLGGEVETR
jgi:uncharacterized membrane protein required for colicin V production